ncbi:neuropeptide FF receptor 2-like [Montipora capricornis]|uniref:neuropeptide FF receptor 2-like n=1 Tax=Montipora capricornis TaxID=246305 RepID=UPI0035F20404
MATSNSSDPEIQCEYHSDTRMEQVFKLTAYFIILFGSLIGNVLVILVVVLNRHMRTVTNYLIVNMAVADLLVTAFNMPVTMKVIATRSMDWSATLCKVIPFTRSLSVASSVFTLAAISIDRFLAIMFPLKRYVTFSIACIMIAVVWIVGIAVSSPIFYAMKIFFDEQAQKSYCLEIWTPVFTENAARDFTIVLFAAFYVLPLLTMSVLYSFLIHNLWVRKVPGVQTQANQRRADRSKKKVLKMLLAVVVVFALSWLPLYITQFLVFFGQETFPCGAPTTLGFLGYFLGYANSAINPAMYAVFNSHFRKGFRDLLLCRCRRNRIVPLVTQREAVGTRGNTALRPARNEILHSYNWAF